MSDEHLITWVGNPRDYRTSAGHELVAYELKVEHDDRVIEWSRKVESPAPQVGELTPSADIVDGPHGPKLKVDWDAVKAKTSQTPSQSAGGTFRASAGSPQGGESQDARQASIVRQHSQEMALRLAQVEITRVIAAAEQGAGKVGSTPLATPEWLEMNLQPIIDWFVADAGGQSRSQVSKPVGEDDLPFARPDYPELFSGPEKGSRGL